MPPPPPPPPGRKGGAKAMMKSLGTKMASPVGSAPSGLPRPATPVAAAASSGVAPTPAVPMKAPTEQADAAKPPTTGTAALPPSSTVALAAATSSSASPRTDAVGPKCLPAAPTVAAEAPATTTKVVPAAVTLDTGVKGTTAKQNTSAAAVAVKKPAAPSAPPMFPSSESVTSAVLKHMPRLHADRPLSAGSEVKVRQYVGLLQKGMTTLIMRRAKSTAQCVLDQLEGMGAFDPRSCCEHLLNKQRKRRMPSLRATRGAAAPKRGRESPAAAANNSDDAFEEEVGPTGGSSRPTNVGALPTASDSADAAVMLSGAQRTRRRRSEAAMAARHAARSAKLAIRQQ